MPPAPMSPQLPLMINTAMNSRGGTESDAIGALYGDPTSSEAIVEQQSRVTLRRHDFACTSDFNNGVFGPKIITSCDDTEDAARNSGPIVTAVGALLGSEHGGGLGLGEYAAAVEHEGAAKRKEAVEPRGALENEGVTEHEGVPSSWVEVSDPDPANPAGNMRPPSGQRLLVLSGEPVTDISDRAVHTSWLPGSNPQRGEPTANWRPPFPHRAEGETGKRKRGSPGPRYIRGFIVRGVLFNERQGLQASTRLDGGYGLA